MTITALVFTKYREKIQSFVNNLMYIFTRLMRNRMVKLRRGNRIADMQVDKFSKVVLSNKYSLNEYLSNDENRDYISRFKIRYYKTQLRALKQEVMRYLKFTNNRLSVEHVIMLQEIKQKLVESGYEFKPKVFVTNQDNLEKIRQHQMKNTIRIDFPNVPVIDDGLREIYKHEYLKQHCLNNTVEAV